MIICNITHIDCHFGINSLYYISTMNKKNIDKIANQPNYNHQLFTLAIATAQACQQLANKTQTLPPDHRQQLGDKPKLLETALKNAISVMGKFADIQKAPLASPMDHSLQIFEGISDSIQMSVQKFRQLSKKSNQQTVKEQKQSQAEPSRPQDKYKFIRPARFEFHNHEKDLSNIRTDLSFTPSRPLQEEFLYVQNEQQLQEMVDDLANQSEIAVDVEHSSKSYQGFTCLIQFSSRSKDYILDVFPLWELVPLLKRVMEDPSIIKVMHGAEMDTKWLQRDFNIHIHNLFDTYRASRTLGLPKLSYAFLLNHYCKVNTDKSYQTADWRQRPLSRQMLHYARLDTHYLLEIFDRLRADIHQKSLSMGLNPQEVFADVYSASHEVTRNEVELFDFSKKECFQQLRKQFKDAQFSIFLGLFQRINEVARENDLPYDEIVNHRLQRQLIARLKELLLVRPENVVIKIDRLIADLRLIEHQSYLRPHLSMIKEYLSSYFAQRHAAPRKEKKPQKSKLTHIEQQAARSPLKIKQPFKMNFEEYQCKTYENLSQNPFSMLKFEPIAAFLAKRLGVSTKQEEEEQKIDLQEVEEQEEEGVANPSEQEESNPEGVIEFKRINPNVIYTVEDNPVEQKYKPRKKRKEEDYEKKMLQKQKNIFQLLEE